MLTVASERSIFSPLDRMGTILVCGETNACADNLAAGALDAGLAVVRVGTPARVCPACLANIHHLQLCFGGY